MYGMTISGLVCKMVISLSGGYDGNLFIAAIGYGLQAGVRFLPRARNVSLPYSFQTALGHTQPHIQRVSGVRRQGHEPDHLSQCSAEVKDGGAVPPLPLTSS
jgi:hypothetical protein